MSVVNPEVRPVQIGGLSWKPRGDTVQDNCWWEVPGVSHSKAKRFCDLELSGIQKKAPLRSKELYQKVSGGMVPSKVQDFGTTRSRRITSLSLSLIPNGKSCLSFL